MEFLSVLKGKFFDYFEFTGSDMPASSTYILWNSPLDYCW